MKWSRGLAESSQVGCGTFLANVASHCLVNAFWVRQTGINDGAVIISLAYLDLHGRGKSEKHIWLRNKSDLYPLSVRTQQTCDQQV